MTQISSGSAIRWLYSTAGCFTGEVDGFHLWHYSTLVRSYHRASGQHPNCNQHTRCLFCGVQRLCSTCLGGTVLSIANVPSTAVTAVIGGCGGLRRCQCRSLGLLLLIEVCLDSRTLTCSRHLLRTMWQFLLLAWPVIPWIQLSSTRSWSLENYLKA